MSPLTTGIGIQSQEKNETRDIYFKGNEARENLQENLIG